MAEVSPTAANAPATLEARLAVVCYGGVSLAIYMSGITREIQGLVTGSAVRLAGIKPSGTAGVYADLLDALEKAASDRGDPHRTQVGVDVVAGTSAGGINGICLTRVLDGDYSQAAIRDFWITEGDFGNNMERHERAVPVSFLFGGSGIDLAVTATEFAGHHVAVPLSRQLVFDEAHRHVFRIHGDGGGSLDPDVGMLAFAARATASFPGAFAPVSLSHFRAQLSAAGQGGTPDSRSGTRSRIRSRSSTRSESATARSASTASARAKRRSSPPDTTVPKLAGMGVHHFGAFFDRPSREKDYLWGRIDGCCHLIALMVDVLRERRSAGAIEPTALMRQACVAVLTEEWHHVPGARELAEHLWHQVSEDPPPA